MFFSPLQVSMWYDLVIFTASMEVRTKMTQSLQFVKVVQSTVKMMYVDSFLFYSLISDVWNGSCR